MKQPLWGGTQRPRRVTSHSFPAQWEAERRMWCERARDVLAQCPVRSPPVSLRWVWVEHRRERGGRRMRPWRDYGISYLMDALAEYLRKSALQFNRV